MRLIILSEHSKFQVDFKNLTTITQNVYGFWDNLIWIGNYKFFVLQREYPWFPAIVLSSSPKISDLIENNFL